MDTVLNNLPVQLTSFIGRDQEMPEVKRLLTTTRLLTLTGSGGTGKTRLALQAAGDLSKANSVDSGQVFPDGVWFIELASLSDPSLVPLTAASVLGIREEPVRPIMATLLEWLHEKALLLILDNCEHLLDACAKFADATLHASRETRILATSREPLGIAGELAWRVAPLATPSSNSAVSIAQLESYTAVRLFVERAAFARSTFAMTVANAPAISQICCRLDGIPLAIELAAARVKAMRPEQIAERLDDRFALLTGGSRTAPMRQQTLRGTIDWSHSLLSEPERVLLRRLSVFAGGWTLEAAEAVCSCGVGTRPSTALTSRPEASLLQGEILDALSHLVDKSLVVLDEQAAEPRYRMLETIRQYAREKLTAAENELTQASHIEFFTQLALTTEQALDGPDQVAWLNRLEAEHDNLRAALSWTLKRDDSDSALRLGGALAWFWFVRGHWSEAWHWLQRALAMRRGTANESRESRTLRNKALAQADAIVTVRGDLEMRRELAEESLALSRELGDKRSTAAALDSLGDIARVQADYATARTLYQESLELRREVGDKRYVAFSLKHLGHIARIQGDYATAWTLCQEGLALIREAGDKRGVAMLLFSLGLVARVQGNYGSARVLYQESLALRREVGDQRGIASSLSSIGDLAYAQGDNPTAQALYQESLALHRESSDKRGMTFTLINLGHLALTAGDAVEAHSKYAECLVLMRESGNRENIPSCLVGWANLAQITGQVAHATKLCGAVEALVKAMNARLESPEREMLQRTITILRAQLVETAFNVAWSEGLAMTMDQAVAEVEQGILRDKGHAPAQAAPANPGGLTPRELDVLRLIAGGLTDIQIAARLVISRRTVSTHLSAIYGKLAVNSRSAATRYAFEHHLV